MPDAQTPNKEILLVEDSDSDAVLTERTLKLAGVLNPVRRLADGNEALRYLQHAEQAGGPAVPAILLLDLKLPNMTGFEILDFLRGRPAFAHTLKIVLSSVDDTKSIKKAYTLGANSFITKPAQHDEIIELVRLFPFHWSLSKDAGVEEILADPRLGPIA